MEIGQPYRSSRLRTSTRSGGRRGGILEVGSTEQHEPTPERHPRAPEWLLLVRAGLNRERAAITVAVIAITIAVVVIVVIPVITGEIG